MTSEGYTMDREFFSDQEIAKKTGIAVKTLRNWRSMKIGPPYFKIESCVRYKSDDVEAYLKSKRIETNGNNN